MKKSTFCSVIFIIALIIGHLHVHGQEKQRLCLKNSSSGERECYDVGCHLAFQADLTFNNCTSFWRGWYFNFAFENILDSPLRLVLSHNDTIIDGQIWKEGYWVYDGTYSNETAFYTATTVKKHYVEAHFEDVYKKVEKLDTIDVTLFKAISFYKKPFNYYGLNPWVSYKLGKKWSITTEK